MFNLRLTDEQEALQDLLRRFAQERLAPVAREAEAQRSIPPEIKKELHAMGVVTPVAEEYGGQGIPDSLTWLLALEELARGDAAVALEVALSGGVAFAIHRCGTPRQQESLLSKLASEPDLRTSLWMYEGFGRAPSEYR